MVFGWDLDIVIGLEMNNMLDMLFVFYYLNFIIMMKVDIIYRKKNGILKMLGNGFMVI